MIPAFRQVVVTTRCPTGDANCDICCNPVTRRFPCNLPQVCKECADKHVWQYRPSKTKRG